MSGPRNKGGSPAPPPPADVEPRADGGNGSPRSGARRTLNEAAHKLGYWPVRPAPHPTNGDPSPELRAATADDRDVIAHASRGVLALGALSAWLMGDFLSIVNIVLTVNIPFGACELLSFFWRRLTAPAVWTCVILSTLVILVIPWTAAKIPALRDSSALTRTSPDSTGRPARAITISWPASTC